MSVIGVGDVENSGGRLVLRPGDRLTPLARDRANELGVVIATGEMPASTVAAAGPRPEPTRPAGGRPAGPHSPTGPADPPVGALYRRGAPVVGDHLRPEVVADLAVPGPALPPPVRNRATVVGAGHVGATTALRLAEADVFDEVVMMDVVPGLAAGLALDLWHSSALSGFATRLRGTSDLSDTAGSDYVVVTAGRARQPGMSRTDLTAMNAAIVGEVAEGIRRYSPDAVVVVVTNPLDEMTHLTWRTTGFPARRVLGMAGVLDATRFCALAALAAGVRPDEVAALALGSHGDEMVVPLSAARIAGAPITARLDAATLDGLVTRTQGSGAEVVALLEKGSAYYAPGAATARMVLAMARDTGAVLPCCVLADGAYGIGEVYLGLPARLGRSGVTGIVEVPLTPAELAELRTAADRIAERVGALTPRLMKAVVYAGPSRVTVDDVAEPRLEEPDDALVRVSLSAICGTDLHLVGGHADVEVGTVLGHEFVGEVIAVGAAVRDVRLGERVFGSDFTACGACWWCRRGDHWECPDRQFFGTGASFGKALAGAQAEIVRVPKASTTLCPVPPGYAPERAIFVGDALATGFAAAERGEVAPGDTVVVLGGGAVGQMASLACQAVGAAVVVVVDLVADRRALAAAQGALAATPEEVEALVRRLTSGRGADVAIDAVGGSRVLDAGLTLVRPRGTVVSVGAHFETSFALPVRRAFAEELTVRFVIGDAIRLRDRLLPLVATGVIDPTVVVSERVGIADVPAAYERFARHEATKILIDM